MRWDKTFLCNIFVLATGISVTTSASLANDDELSDFTEEDIFIDIPQVVSATRQNQRLTEAPASITLLSEHDIATSGALTIPDLFRLVPGMQSYQVIANRSVTSYHGMSNDHPGRMEVMLNGHSVYLPLLSTVAWETIGITLEDIDHIEVVRGSNVPAYGSNAFAGAINIVTKNPIVSEESNLGITTGALNTNIGHYNFSGSSDELAYRVSAKFEENDGYHIYDDGLINRTLNVSGTYAPNISDSIDFNFGFSTGQVGIGQADNLSNNFSPRKHSSNFQHIRWNRVLNDQNEIKLSFTHNYLNLEERFVSAAEALTHNNLNPAFAPFLAPIQPLGTEHGSMDLYDIELEYRHSYSSELTSVWGAGYRHEAAESATLLLDQGEVTEDKWRLFSNIQWSPSESWSLNAGGMFEKTSITSSTFSPRLAANYLINNRSSIRSSITRAYRTPSLLEKNSNSGFINSSGGFYDLITRPNPDIRPEKLTTYELGYFHQFPDKQGHFDLRIFNEHFNNAIASFSIADGSVDDLSDGYRISSNTASWRNTGAEFQLKYQVAPSFSILSNYGYLNVKGVRNRGGSPADFDSLADRTPLHTASVKLGWDPSVNHSINLIQYYMSGVKWLEGGYRKQYRRTDLVVNNIQPLQNSELHYNFIVQNLFDETYPEFYEFNYFDRRAYLQLELKF